MSRRLVPSSHRLALLIDGVVYPAHGTRARVLGSPEQCLGEWRGRRSEVMRAMRDRQFRFSLGKGLLVAALGVLLSGWIPWLVRAQEPNAASNWRAGPEVTLDDALRSAFERHPDLRAASALVDEARGRLVGAKSYPFNPRFTAVAGPRTGVVDKTTDLAFVLNQRVQIAGQRPRSKRAAEIGVSAEQARWERTARLLAARVHVTFINAVAEIGRAHV